jgi:hypothetical protein
VRIIFFSTVEMKKEINIKTAKPNSTLFNAEKTVLPTSRPTSSDKDGAVNLTGASIKLIAATNPTQIKVTIKE